MVGTPWMHMCLLTPFVGHRACHSRFRLSCLPLSRYDLLNSALPAGRYPGGPLRVEVSVVVRLADAALRYVRRRRGLSGPVHAGTFQILVATVVTSNRPMPRVEVATSVPYT